MFMAGKGALLDKLRSFGLSMDGFRPSGQSSLRTVLPWMLECVRIILVHNTFTTSEDMRWAIAQHRGLHWCTCPSANLYIEGRIPNVEDWLRSGAQVCIGTLPVLYFGTAEQKARMLPPLIAGREKACFAVTEPNTGLDTTKLRTFAERRGDRYIVHGQKVWISTAQVADRVLLLARTTPIERVAKRSEGLTLFYTALDRARVEVREIPKMGRHAVDSNQLFIDGLEVPVEDRIGEEGRGFDYILHGLNPERILVAAEAVGIGHAAIARAASYAKERVVFGRPIGQNQGVQHPLAACWMKLEAARLMTMQAAWRYDQGLNCGAEANAAKWLGGEAGFEAAETAVMTLGGYGYAEEFHLERLLRESFIPRIAPGSPQLILCHIAERVLGLPKSY
jgi:acyl-CoA dehydrogenase